MGEREGKSRPSPGRGRDPGGVSERVSGDGSLVRGEDRGRGVGMSGSREGGDEGRVDQDRVVRTGPDSVGRVPRVHLKINRSVGRRYTVHP